MKKLAIMIGTVVLATVALVGGAVTPASAQGYYGYRGWWGGGYRDGAYARSYAFAPRARIYHRGRPYRSYRNWWGGGYW